MTVKGALRNLLTALETEPTKNTIPGLLGEISVALGGESDGKTVAEQIQNIAIAAGPGGVNPHMATLTFVGSSDTAVINLWQYLDESTGYFDQMLEAPLIGSYVVPLYKAKLSGGGTYSTEIYNNGERLSMTSSGDITISEEVDMETYPYSYSYVLHITGDCTITLSEPVVKYTVTYNVNGGTGSIDPVEVAAGESITLNDGSGLSHPDSYEFLGWAKTSSAMNPTVESPFTPDKDITLYAVWSETQQEPQE